MRLEIEADSTSEAEATRVAKSLLEELSRGRVDTAFEVKPADSDSQAMGSIVTMVVTSAVFTGIVEAVKGTWGLYRKPLQVRSSNGKQLTFNGNVEEFQEFIHELGQFRENE